MLIGIFFLAELGMNGLDVLGDFDNVSAEMILKVFDANKGRTDITGHETLLTFREDMIREGIHIDVFMTGEAFGLVVFVIHVFGKLRFQHGLSAIVACFIFIAAVIMFLHIGAGADMTTFTFDMIIRTFLKDMTCHLEMRRGAGRAFLKGTREEDALVLVHHQIIDSERLLFGELMQMTRHGTEHAFLLDGSIISILMEFKKIFKTQEADTFHGKTRDFIVIISAWETNRLDGNHNGLQANTARVHLPLILGYHSSLFDRRR